MKSTLLICLAIWTLGAFSAMADTRMQVAVPATPVHSRPDAAAYATGKVNTGDILFVTRTEGDWAAVSPPEHIGVWLNKVFVEGNRVVAKSIQVRCGPGIQYDIVGTLSRGAPVMPLEEQGEWCKISPPSSVTLWVERSRLSEVTTHTTPIREVAPVAEPAPPPEPAHAPVVAQTPPPPAPTPAPAPVRPKATPQKIAPSKPTTTPAAPSKPASPKPIALRPATAVPRPAAIASPKPSAPVAPSTVPTPATPATTARPVRPPLSATTGTASPALRRSEESTAPAPALTPPKKRTVPAVQVDPALVEELNLDASRAEDQGRPVQVKGQLRNAPLATATPSRYRLVSTVDGVLRTRCYLHGDPELLRPHVNRAILVRGREYWTQEDPSIQVVVVSRLVSAEPARTTDAGRSNAAP